MSDTRNSDSSTDGGPTLRALRNSSAAHETKSDFFAGIEFDPTYMKEGYLQKKGQLLKAWKARWFVCDGKTLSYYLSNKDKKPNAVMPLDQCTVQDGGMSETWNSPRIYLTDGITGTVYCLSAEEGSVVTEWLKVLVAATARSKGDSKSEQHNSNNSRYIQKVAQRLSPKRNVANHESNSPKLKASFENKKTEASSSVKKIPTSTKLESELTSAFETIEKLIKSSTAFTLNTVAADGVRVGIYTADNQKQFARGSVVINSSPDIIRALVTNVKLRNEWDTDFTQGSVVASYDRATELVYLKGSTTSAVIALPVPPVLAGAVGALVGIILGCWILGFFTAFTSAVTGAAIGICLSTVDCQYWTKPRDLLLVTHLRDLPDGSCFLLERSVVNELKPTETGVVRATITAGGFLIQPLEVETAYGVTLQTLLTYITDIDIGGWIPPSCKSEFLTSRVRNVVNIREYVLQSSVFGTEGLPTERKSLSSEEDSSEKKLKNDDDAAWQSQWKRGMIRNAAGGLKLIDKEIAKKQKGVLMEVLKSFGAAILEGNSAVSLSLPVRIFEPRSTLERLVDLWLYGPSFLTRAAETTDAEERMKLVMCFAVAGLHLCVGQLKPFNPILGETYQTKLSDGSDVCCEHTSHHPPISNFQILGKGYMLWGYFILGGSFKTNALTQVQTGPVHIDFDDGSRVTYNMPYLNNGGFLWGDRVVELLGSMTFKDEKNNLKCDLKFNPDEKKGMGSMFSAPKTPSDSIRGTVVRTSEANKVLCDVSGSWLENLKFGEKVYWDIEKDLCKRNIRLENVMPSDCRFREDLLNLQQENLDDAQEWKLKLEKLQRADRALRKDGRRPNHWANNNNSSH